MKNFKKVVSLAVVLVFPLLAVTVVMAHGEGNRQDGEHPSKRAKNVKIHPRVLLKGADAEKFKKIKKHDEELAIKGRLDNPGQLKKDKTPSPECGSAATIYLSNDKVFAGDFCAVGDLVGEIEPDFPTQEESACWECATTETNIVSCSANIEKERDIMAMGKFGAELNGEKYAIVIGICDYPDYQGVNDICTSDGDARYMARALHTEYDFPLENIYLFRDLVDGHITTGGMDLDSFSATKHNILRAIADVSENVQSGDEVVFFFSGHGVTGKWDGGDNDDEILDEAILVHNGIENKNKNDSSGQLEYIWDDELKDWFSDFPTDRITFIFDTCRAEGMNDVMEGYLENDNGRVFVAGTEEEATAYVYSTGVNGEGVFSHYFVRSGMCGYVGPGGGWADGYNAIGWDHRTEDGWLSDSPVTGQDGYVVVEEAYEYAREKIALYFSTSSIKQIPVIEDLFTNDLLLGYYLPII